MTFATCRNYLSYPPPTVYLADAHSGYQSNPVNELPLMSLPFLMWPSIGRGDGRIPLQQTDSNVNSTSPIQSADSSASVRLLTYSTPSGQYELLLSPIEPSSSTVPEEPEANTFMRETENDVAQRTIDAMETDVQPEERGNQIFPLVDPSCWEVPFLQGWLIGQSQAGQQTINPFNGGASENLSAFNRIDNLVPPSFGHSRVTGRSGSRHRSSRPRTSANGSVGDVAPSNIAHDESDSQPFLTQIQSEIAASLAAAAAAELPCTVKLRLWPHNVKDPCQSLDAEKCRLIIPHAVLCSEMGAHFSPCGRFLAACVACVLPNVESDPGFQGHMHHDVTGVATSPTRHPIAAHQVMYELRIYSLEEATSHLHLSTCYLPMVVAIVHYLRVLSSMERQQYLFTPSWRFEIALEARLKSKRLDGKARPTPQGIIKKLAPICSRRAPRCESPQGVPRLKPRFQQQQPQFFSQ